jgi:ABC-2 type transport system ATP-binding protein
VLVDIAVELTDVCKSFGKVEALRGLDLQVRRGEVYSLLGPNGAGKTTSVSLMLGLRRPTAGTVRVLGCAPDDRRVRSRSGVMLQESGVPQTLTVREVVETFASYYPNPIPVSEAIARAGLESKANSKVGGLSGGQRQRLYFALAVIGNPELLYLDEPTVGMDVETRRHFWEQIRSLADQGRTILLTTHYLEEADALSHRIGIIDRGRLIAEGTPSQIKGQVNLRQVRFSTDAPLDAAQLAGLPVQRLELTGNRVSLVSTEPEEVLWALFSKGIRVRELEVAGGSLEEAFLYLTDATNQEESRA